MCLDEFDLMGPPTKTSLLVDWVDMLSGLVDGKVHCSKFESLDCLVQT